uniref:Apple domain-containing protein n=1 Tax=Tetradesmus obliquus TaxID=3088 RepID=A0A383W0C6_TETOB|eukprot:jgi/Sobl393_1/16078/SZX71148.1
MRALTLLLVLSGAVAAYSSRPSAAGRGLLQSAYSCSTQNGGCTACPAGCSTTGCVRTSTGGLWVCTRCTPFSTTLAASAPNNTRPGVDGSCGCAPGYYLIKSASAWECRICDLDSYCPGGTEFESQKKACPTGMVTRTLGSTGFTFCVNAPGYSYTAPRSGWFDPPSQTPCPINTFNPGYNRLATCTPCPPGLKTSGGLGGTGATPFAQAASIPTGYTKSFPAIATDATTMATNQGQCLVPPGFYVTSSNKVVRCPKGEFRAGYAAAGTSSSKCNRCPRGTTTWGAASQDISYCDQILPGHYWKSASASVALQAADPSSEVVHLCDRGSYCPDKYPVDSASNPTTGRIYCQGGLWTRIPGAKSAADCMVPPGYKYNTVGGSLSQRKCSTSDGEFFNDWRAWNATGVDKCDECGSSTGALTIKSDDYEPVPTFWVMGFSVPATTDNLARTSRSCYIEAGEGMVLDKGVYRKIQCKGRNYGVSNRTYGLSQNPCKDCPLGMVTTAEVCSNSAYTAPGGFFDPRACCVPKGFGFDGVEAKLCARGTYNDGMEGPADMCKPCPEGTTTKPNSALASDVDDITDCAWTRPGYGRVANDGWTPGTALAKCAIGTYSVGEVPASADPAPVCTPCSPRTTLVEGATNEGFCAVCPPGQGESNAETTTCSACKSGFFGSARRGPGDTACKKCPGATSTTFNFLYGPSNNPMPVEATTVTSATSVLQCLLSFASVMDANWYYFAGGSDMTIVTAGTDVACMNKCGETEECQFFTWDYKDQKCYLRAPTTGGDGKVKVAYKVLAGTNMGEERRRALLANNRTASPKMMGSGEWSWWNDAAAGTLGTTYSLSGLSSTATMTECLVACNDDEECAAAVLTATAPILDSTASVTCTFKKGLMLAPNTEESASTKRSMLRYRTIMTDKPSGM